MWYLDGYFYGALLGKLFPTNSYGPASLEEVAELERKMVHNFDRTELTQQTMGQNPLPQEYWPGVERVK